MKNFITVVVKYCLLYYDNKWEEVVNTVQVAETSHPQVLRMRLENQIKYNYAHSNSITYIHLVNWRIPKEEELISDKELTF